LFFIYFCTVKYKPKMVMSTVLFHIIVAAKRISYAFGLCFCVLILFTPLLKHLILLAKQAFVCKTLIISPPSTEKQCSLGVGGNDFYRGCFPHNELFYFRPTVCLWQTTKRSVYDICTCTRVANGCKRNNVYTKTYTQ